MNFFATAMYDDSRYPHEPAAATQDWTRACMLVCACGRWASPGLYLSRAAAMLPRYVRRSAATRRSGSAKESITNKQGKPKKQKENTRDVATSLARSSPLSPRDSLHTFRDHSLALSLSRYILFGNHRFGWPAILPVRLPRIKGGGARCPQLCSITGRRFHRPSGVLQ